MRLGALRCELRDHEANDIVPLPIRKDNGDLETLACLDHARELGYFCDQHQRAHLGFEDGTHACMLCIEDRVTTAGIQVSIWYWQVLKKSLPEKEFHRILEVAQYVPVSHPSITLLRWIVIAAFRFGQTDQEIVQGIIDSKSAQIILPIEELERE